MAVVCCHQNIIIPANHYDKSWNQKAPQTYFEKGIVHEKITYTEGGLRTVANLVFHSLQNDECWQLRATRERARTEVAF